MRLKTIPEQELVKICMARLCKAAGFTDKLVQRDMAFLCDSIEEKTGVLISLSTMKRLLNGQFSRLPQIATLNALAGFLGYQSWQDFKLSEGVQSEKPPRRSFKYIPYLAGAVVLLGFVALMSRGKRKLAHADKARFSFVKTTSNDVPNTVVFSYNVDDVSADSFFIQQSWDRNRRIRVYKHNYTLTDIYYEPGYHTAKLIANDQVIKTIDVSIPTDRWFLYAKDNVPRSTPKYIWGGALTRQNLLNSQIDLQKDYAYISVYFPSKIAYSSDNLVLKFRIKVEAVNNTVCPYFMCEIFCQRNFMYFISTLKGCTSRLQAQFGEDTLSGRTHDLSSLGTDVSSWQDAELRIVNRVVSVRINGKEVLSTTYSQTCGMITGLGFISNGLCKVDSVDLSTTDGKILVGQGLF